MWRFGDDSGLTCVCALQVLPNGDPKAIPAWFMAEKTVYDNLE